MKNNGIRSISHLKELRFILIANFISKFGDSLDSIAYPWMIYILTGSKLLMSTLFAINAIPSIVLSPFLGVIIDRIPKKKILIVGNIVRGIIVCATTFLFISNKLKPWHLFIFTFINATSDSVISPASKAILPIMIPKELFLSANSFLSSSYQFAELLGLASSGIIISFTGPAWAVFINGITFFIASFIILLIPLSEQVNSINKLNIHQYFIELKEGMLFVKNSPAIFISICLLGLGNFCMAPMTILMPAFIKDNLRVGAEVYSTVSVSLMIGSIIGGLLISNFGTRFKSYILTCFGFSAFGLAYSCIYVPVNLAIPTNSKIMLITIVFFFIGFFMPIATTPISSNVLTSTPKNLLGRVSAVLNMITKCSVPLGSIITGIVSVHISIPKIFLLMGVLIFLVALLTSFSKDFRNT